MMLAGGAKPTVQAFAAPQVPAAQVHSLGFEKSGTMLMGSGYRVPQHVIDEALGQQEQQQQQQQGYAADDLPVFMEQQQQQQQAFDPSSPPASESFGAAAQHWQQDSQQHAGQQGVGALDVPYGYGSPGGAYELSAAGGSHSGAGDSQSYLDHGPALDQNDPTDFLSITALRAVSASAAGGGSRPGGVTAGGATPAAYDVDQLNYFASLSQWLQGQQQ
jgi:hypothetical protein